VRILRETTEKITETLTEQKTTDNLGLIKKTETRNFVTDNGEDPTSDQSTTTVVGAEEYSSVSDVVKQIGDDLYLFDRTKSYNISKRMKKYDDEVAAGFISDIDSKRIINQSNKINK
jgi:hypothetical protein